MTTKITGDNITDGSVTEDDLNANAKSSGATDGNAFNIGVLGCLLYTSPSPRDQEASRMPSSA